LKFNTNLWLDAVDKQQQQPMVGLRLPKILMEFAAVITIEFGAVETLESLSGNLLLLARLP
jgi:hypothetical protein